MQQRLYLFIKFILYLYYIILCFFIVILFIYQKVVLTEKNKNKQTQWQKS